MVSINIRLWCRVCVCEYSRRSIVDWKRFCRVQGSLNRMNNQYGNSQRKEVPVTMMLYTTKSISASHRTFPQLVNAAIVKGCGELSTDCTGDPLETASRCPRIMSTMGEVAERLWSPLQGLRMFLGTWFPPMIKSWRWSKISNSPTIQPRLAFES